MELSVDRREEIFKNVASIDGERVPGMILRVKNSRWVLRMQSSHYFLAFVVGYDKFDRHGWPQDVIKSKNVLIRTAGFVVGLSFPVSMCRREKGMDDMRFKRRHLQ